MQSKDEIGTHEIGTYFKLTYVHNVHIYVHGNYAPKKIMCITTSQK